MAGFNNYSKPNNGYGGNNRQGGYGGNSKQGGYGSSAPVQPAAKAFEFNLDYLKNGYKRDDGTFNTAYLISLAKSIGKSLQGGETGKSKIRTYYDSVESISTRVLSGEMTDEQAKIQLAMLIPRVADRFAKGTASETFKVFIEKNVNYLIDKSKNFKEDLVYFKLHFEAVVCFAN